MFQTPSLGLSHADIEKWRKARRARAQNSSPTARTDGSGSSTSVGIEETDQQNISSARENAKHNVDVTARVTPPPKASPWPPPDLPPPPVPSESTEQGHRRLPSAFMEPRPAPSPPKRPPRPPSEFFLPPTPGGTRHERPSGRKLTRRETSPVGRSVAERSPLRRAITQDGTDPSFMPRPLFSKSTSSSSSSSGRGSVTAEDASPQPSPAIRPANAALARMGSRSRRGSGDSASSMATAQSLPIRLGRLGKASTAPPSLNRSRSSSPFQVVRKALIPGQTASASRGRAHHGRKTSLHSLDSCAKRRSVQSLDSSVKRRSARMQSDVAARIREVLEAEDTGRVRKQRDAVSKPAKPVTPPDGQTKGRRKRKKGETMSMLLDAGFFPVEEIIYGKTKKKRSSKPVQPNFRIYLPPRLSFSERDLPGTPTSIIAMPTELHQSSPLTPRSRTRSRRSGVVGHRVLCQISGSDDNAAVGGFVKRQSDSASLSGLAAIPEDSTPRENTPPSSGVATPVATQIHLRGGSIVTVTPPELTAWKPSIYLHGPIKLPKPAIMPRKNSVASLDPFQEAIDLVYQHALSIPRRRSDDAVVDDICEFFDDYGFDAISFDGDKLSVFEINIDEVSELEAEEDLERFSTPPPELSGTSLVQTTVAEEVLETTSSEAPPGLSASIPYIVAPPVETAETLRARGIARLSRNKRNSSAGSGPVDLLPERKESFTLGKLEMEGLPFLPAPEPSMLEAVLEPSVTSTSDSTAHDASSYAPSVRSSRKSRGNSTYAPSVQSSRFGKDSASVYSGRTDHGGMDWDSDVAEIDGASTWVAPVVPTSKKSGLSSSRTTRKSRNPVIKMRQMMATASTIL